MYEDPRVGHFRKILNFLNLSTGRIHKYEALFWSNVNISNFSKEMATILPKLQFQYLIFAKYKIKGWMFLNLEVPSVDYNLAYNYNTLNTKHKIIKNNEPFHRRHHKNVHNFLIF